ncbi:MAG TPA: hypothetical protein VMW41_02450 [Candidatus Bathyarchaeia archaeon]|nr:hypothetical protein [Candidatus Bathyarchaeia archaeon]
MINLLAHINNSNQSGQTQEYSWGMMGGSGMMGGWPMMGGGWFGGFFGLVTWILTILVLIALFRWLWQKGNLEKGS